MNLLKCKPPRGRRGRPHPRQIWRSPAATELNPVLHAQATHSSPGSPRALLQLSLSFLNFFIPGGLARGADTEPAELALFTLNSRFESTSARISLFSVETALTNHRRDFFWPYGTESETAFDFGGKAEIGVGSTEFSTFRYGRILAAAGWKFSPRLQLRADCGVTYLTNTFNNESETFVAGLQLLTRPLSPLLVGLSFSHDAALLGLQPGAVQSHLRETQITGRVDLRIHERVKLSSKNWMRFFSDQNIKYDSQIELMFGIAPTSPWIWIGLGAQAMAFKVSTELQPTEFRYWAPLRFLAADLRFESDLPLSSEISIFLGAAASVFQEESYPVGFGYFLAPGLSFGNRERRQLRISYTRIVSRQTAGAWISNAGSASLQMSF